MKSARRCALDFTLAATRRACAPASSLTGMNLFPLLMNLAKTYSQLLFLMYVSVRNIKSVAPLTVPLFNPSEIQLGKKDIRKPFLTTQWNLPSKGRD